MNFVYICIGGENPELRYSIRTVLDSFPDANIWVVGGVPNWYKGPKIPIEQNSGKWPNAVNNLNAIVSSNDIPEEFVLMNDDFFIVKKIDSIKHYHQGLLSKKIETYSDLKMDNIYLRKLGSTYAKLERMGISEPLSYETHTPMLMLKERLGEVMQYCPTNLWRSLYGNIHKVGGEEIQDVKVYYREKYKSLSLDYKNTELPYISTDDESFAVIRDQILQKKFKTKSPFER